MYLTKKENDYNIVNKPYKKREWKEIKRETERERGREKGRKRKKKREGKKEREIEKIGRKGCL